MWLHRILLTIGCILHAHSATAIWSCTQNEDCNIMTGSSCVNSECVCPAGLQAVSGGTACAETPLYYMSPCFDDYQCSRLVSNFQCTKAADSNGAGVCTCQANHHYAQGRCWPSSGWSTECSADVQCMGPLRDPFNMMCRDSICVCADSYYLRQRGECRRSGTEIGAACVVNEDCQFDGGRCNTANFTCVASEDLTGNATDVYTSQTQLGTDVSPASSLVKEHRSVCNSNANCTSPFECTNLGVCACPRGFYPDSSNKNCLAYLGTPSSTEQCVGLFKEVRDGICTCQANFYFGADYRSCAKAALRLTDFCFDDVNCHTFGAAARCGPPKEFGLRSCECNADLSVWNADRQMCVLAAGIGDACEKDSDCFVDSVDVKCVKNNQGQGVCSCPEDYEAVNGLCLKFGQKLGEACQYNVECADTANAVCSSGVCSCASGYLQLNDLCAPEIGGGCTQSSDCAVNNTVCTSGTCQCAPNYVEADVSCWKVAQELGSPCNVTKQCSVLGEGTACLNQECACDTTHHYKDGRCWRKTELFQPCRSSNECFLGEFSQRVHCRNSLCQCTFDYQYSEVLKTCSSSAFRTLSSHVSIIATALLYIYFSQ